MFVEGGLHPEQVKALRKMSLQRRADLALGCIRSMRQLKKAALRSQHPDWSEERISAEARHLTAHARG
ncbi:MAG: hypothetical protein ACR2ID_02425 [Chthoniobacterales bacterium]